MDREQDIFEQPAKVQNMNHVFDESSQNSTAATPQRRVRPAQSREGVRRSSSDAPAQSRNIRQLDGSAKTRTSAGSQVRKTRPADGEPVRRVRPADGSQPAKKTRPATSGQTVRKVRPAEEQTKQIRTASPSQPVKTRPVNAETTAKKVRAVEAETPAVKTPVPAKVNEAAPQKVNPQKAAPRRVAAEAPTENRTRQSVRTSSEAASSVRNKKSGKKKGGFKKFIIIYSAALLLILVVGWIVFSSFIGKYEKNQPSNMVASIAKDLSGGKAKSFLKSNSDQINCLENVDNIIDKCAANLEGKTISYIENSDYRADAPSYNLTADNQIVAKVTLEKSEKGSFGLYSWKLASLDVTSYLEDTLTYKIMAPEGATVTVNGTELTEKYRTTKAGVPAVLETASKYVSVPSYETYTVSGFTSTPTVSATSGGNTLDVSQTSDSFLCGSATPQSFIDSVSSLVDHAIDAWGRHFINYGGNLSAYILEDSDWYGYIFGSDTMDPIYTSFYEFESIADATFTEKSATNYIQYTPDCFTVDVKYQMQIDFTTDAMSDNNQKLDATWVFITQNDGQDWYIVDCIYKN